MDILLKLLGTLFIIGCAVWLYIEMFINDQQ